ncbi:3-hydroxyacyl-ACP dehydratase FabZ family protein [Desulfogranum japonicum]|uniref:3-hydroxyacyl-ACP dehydratase FabZ family protein n=1 Tax=Desulfogranum japonicum TaxID=231447 RepID=UPI0003FBC6A8|nr:3-hydroxyacyl-ACP dehydratase FabZ family protein [Desulfogranum japonicum]
MGERGKEYICRRIPHREPFLWLDRVVEISDDSIVAEKEILPDTDLFKGHYPDYPLMPGVILCEAVFQAGALLIGELVQGNTSEVEQGVPVLTRIQGARFKREVRPGDTITVSATIKECLAGAWFLKGSVKVGGKTAVQVDFSCALKG